MVDARAVQALDPGTLLARVAVPDVAVSRDRLVEDLDELRTSRTEAVAVVDGEQRVVGLLRAEDLQLLAQRVSSAARAGAG
jgi:hypothetical protein